MSFGCLISHQCIGGIGNPMEKSFLSTHHPSLPHGASVDVDSLWLFVCCMCRHVFMCGVWLCVLYVQAVCPCVWCCVRVCVCVSSTVHVRVWVCWACAHLWACMLPVSCVCFCGCLFSYCILVHVCFHLTGMCFACLNTLWMHVCLCLFCGCVLCR